MKRTPRCSDAAQGGGNAAGQQTLRAPEVSQAANIPPLALHRPSTRAPESSVPWGKALLLSAMDRAPKFCQNGKKESNESWRSSLSAYWFFLSSGGKYGGGGGWSVGM